MDRPCCAPPRGVSRIARALVVAMLALGLVSGLSGCQIIIGVLLMLGGPPKIDSDFRKFTKKSLMEKGKQVAILSSSRSAALSEHPSLDVDVIAEVSRKLRAQGVKVVDDHEIMRYIDENGGITDETDLARIAPQFKADYIVLFKFDEFGFKEPNSAGLYRGHARGNVIVVEFTTTDEERTARTIYKKPFDSKYPLHQPVSSDQENPGVFQQRYLARLAEELSRLFYDHRPGEEM